MGTGVGGEGGRCGGEGAGAGRVWVGAGGAGGCAGGEGGRSPSLPGTSVGASVCASVCHPGCFFPLRFPSCSPLYSGSVFPSASAAALFRIHSIKPGCAPCSRPSNVSRSAMNASVLGSQSAMPGTALPSAMSLLVKARKATAFFSAAGPFIGLPVVRDFAFRVQIPLLRWQAWHRPHTTPFEYTHSMSRFLQWSQEYGFGSVSRDGLARADTHRLRLRRSIHLLAFALVVGRASLTCTSPLARHRLLRPRLRRLLLRRARLGAPRRRCGKRFFIRVTVFDHLPGLHRLLRLLQALGAVGFEAALGGDGWRGRGLGASGVRVRRLSARPRCRLSRRRYCRLHTGAWGRRRTCPFICEVLVAVLNTVMSLLTLPPPERETRRVPAEVNGGVPILGPHNGLQSRVRWVELRQVQPLVSEHHAQTSGEERRELDSARHGVLLYCRPVPNLSRFTLARSPVTSGITYQSVHHLLLRLRPFRCWRLHCCCEPTREGQNELLCLLTGQEFSLSRRHCERVV